MSKQRIEEKAGKAGKAFCPHCETRLVQLSDHSWLCPNCDYWDVPEIVLTTPEQLPAILDTFPEVF